MTFPAGDPMGDETLTDEELIARVSAAGGVTLDRMQAAQAWMFENRIRAGVAEGPEPVDVHRHYVAWAAERGHPTYTLLMFGRFLRRAGFHKRRTWRDGRELRPYDFHGDTTTRLFQWLGEHPTPPSERRRPNLPKTKVEELIEELGE